MAKQPRVGANKDPLINTRVGKLLIMKRVPLRKNVSANIRVQMLVECDCGNRVIVPRVYLLRKPNPKSDCGNCGKEVDTPKTYWPEYHVWKMMNERCYNKKHVSYENYGGKGTGVCKQWFDRKTGFEQFFADVGRRPSPQHSLDRIDPFGHYEPRNVRWATAKEQMANQRKHHEQKAT